VKQSKIYVEGADCPARKFRTAVSLHSHTLHSRETLAFIGSLADRSKLCRVALDRGKRQYLAAHGVALDLSRGWWTPPLAPFDAWLLESGNIESKYDRSALVSLTDHDCIDAALALRVLTPCQQMPISLEWTVPYGPTFFHLGVHNIPHQKARDMTQRLVEFTASRRTADLEEILSALVTNRETLVVFNHPCWDEQAIGLEAHMHWATQFITNYQDKLHAFELNGLRPWPENRNVIRLAFEFDKPVVGGGDRHAVEPNTTLDLSDAATFPEFVEQVRSGWTNVLITRQYSEPFKLRILQSLQEVLAYREDHGRGWKRWSDRVFFEGEDGVIRSLTEVFGNRAPAPIALLIAAVELSRHRRLLNTFRFAFPKEQDVTL
jgi:hypothetical protein